MSVSGWARGDEKLTEGTEGDEMPIEVLSDVLLHEVLPKEFLPSLFLFCLLLPGIFFAYIHVQRGVHVCTLKNHLTRGLLFLSLRRKFCWCTHNIYFV